MKSVRLLCIALSAMSGPVKVSVSLVLLLFLVGATHLVVTAMPSQPEKAEQSWGDLDCDGDVDSVDSLKGLRYVVALPVAQNEPCPDIGSTVELATLSTYLWGDLDCDGDVDSVDSLKGLRYVVALPVSQLPGCPLIGGLISIEPSPAPSVSPTPTPTEAAANDVILVSSNAFTTTSSVLLDGESRRLHIVGELRNDSSTLRSAGKIRITIYDATGTVVGRRWTYAFDDLIRPGRTTAFDEEVPSMFYWSDETNDYPEGWATYEITLSPRDPYSSEGPPLDVTVHDVEASIGDYNWLYIRGTVRNDDSRPQKWNGDVYAILYDGDDNILNTSTDSFDVLQPGQSTEFEIVFYDDEPIGYSRYLVQAYAEAD